MTERMENALRHIKTAIDVDPWAVEEVERVFNSIDRPQERWLHICRDDDVYDIKGRHTWAIKYYCPRCNYKHKFIEDVVDYYYCPKCGANMLEVQNVI